MKNACINMCHTCLEQKKIFFLPFFRHFLSALPSAQTIKVIGLIFFLWSDLEKLDYEHAFQPYTYSLRPFSRGGGRQTRSLCRVKIRSNSLFIPSILFTPSNCLFFKSATPYTHYFPKSRPKLLIFLKIFPSF